MALHDEHKRGTELTREEQRYVLSAYVNRFTKDHKPAWANKVWKDGKTYPVQFASDAEWLANTWFPVDKSGKLKRGRGVDCQSRPTWPDNPELHNAGPCYGLTGSVTTEQPPGEIVGN